MVILAKLNEILKARLSKYESKLGIVPVSFVIGFVLIILSANYVDPSIHPNKFGVLYNKIAANPFDFVQDETASLRFRLLTPAVAYLLNLGGSSYVLLPYFMALVLVALVYFAFRKENFDPGTSLLASLIIAFSGPVLSIFYFRGYPDTMSYVLIMLTMLTIRKHVWPIFFSLALLNHESNLFVFPWLLLLGYTTNIWNRKIFLILLYTIAALLPFVVVRLWISSHISVEYNISYYLNINLIRENLGHMYKTLFLGVFMTFKLFWTLPVVASYYLFKQKMFSEIILIWSLIIFAFCQLIIAVDITRLMSLSFPAILLSVAYIYKLGIGERLNEKFFLLFLFNLFVPQATVIREFIIVQIPFLYNKLFYLLLI